MASSGASFVIHSHVKTEHQRAPFPRMPRRGNGDQSDAQQVRAARQPHRLRLTRARFGRPSRPLPRALIAPCLKQGMDHGCLPCAIQSFAEALLSLAQQRELARSRRARRSAWLDTIDGRYAARLGMPRSSADELQRPLFSCSPRAARCASSDVYSCSAFEGECGTLL